MDQDQIRMFLKLIEKLLIFERQTARYRNDSQFRAKEKFLNHKYHRLGQIWKLTSTHSNFL